MSDSNELNLADCIRDIPDFPKPGILFRDITTLLSNPKAFDKSVADMAEPFRGKGIDVVVGAEARGFIFAPPIAMTLGASLVPIRKPGKLPYETISYSYELEYGTDTLEMHKDAIPEGANVLVVDDLLATGGTIEACCKLVEKGGGRVAGIAFLIELVGLEGIKKIEQYEVVSLIKFD